MYRLLQRCNFGTSYIHSACDYFEYDHVTKIGSTPEASIVSLPHYFPESRKNKSGACCFDNSHPLLSLSRHFYSHPIIHPPYLWFLNIRSSCTTLGSLQEHCERTFLVVATCDNHSATLWAASSSYLFTGLLVGTNRIDVDNLYSWEILILPSLLISLSKWTSTQLGATRSPVSSWRRSARSLMNLWTLFTTRQGEDSMAMR